MSDFSSEAGAISFDQLADCYSRLGAFNPPSEFHGLLTGKLISGKPLSTEELLQLAAGQMGVEEIPKAESALFLNTYRSCLSQLYGNDLSYTLMLPDDDHALADRLVALASWCRGFLEGVALVLGGQLKEIDDEVKGIVRDFSEIAQVDDALDESEEAEQQYSDIVEYVKTSTLTLFFEFESYRPALEDADSKPSTH